MEYSISGKIVDPIKKRIFPGTIHVINGKIAAILEESTSQNHYILPGFIDAHIHIESSMLVPSEFSRLAVVHGTIATVSDPHEIGNVLGMKGIRYMCDNSNKVPFYFFFGAPSCVPATSFETSGAIITPKDIRTLFEEDHLKYLSEVMNFPGVLGKDPDVLEKIRIAHSMNKPVDGHAPGMTGENAKQYAASGISTDHECISLNEALEKIQYGMKVIIREGSAAMNYTALQSLIKLHPDKIMFCSDDKHPNELVEGHINEIVRRSMSLGYDLMDVLKAACIEPNQHYGLNVGQLQQGDPADFIVVNDLKDFQVKATYIQGKLVAFEGKSLIEHTPVDTINACSCTAKSKEDFRIKASGKRIHVIKIVPKELTTNKSILEATIENGCYISDPKRDILKLVVVNRYKNAPPSIGFVQGFGLTEGALASSVAHDSHNIIAVGVDDASLVAAVNAVIESKGGISLVRKNDLSLLPLPIAGLMSDQDGYIVASKYTAIKKEAHNLGSQLPDPFMTLSFLALLVIPSIKLSDLGLFDGDSFQFIPLSAG